jgi:hypothetical protein
MMPELALDDRHGYPFVRHLDRVRVPQLVRSEPAAHPRLGREPAQLAPGCGRRPSAAAGWPGKDAEQRTDRIKGLMPTST